MRELADARDGYCLVLPTIHGSLTAAGPFAGRCPSAAPLILLDFSGCGGQD